MQLQGKKPDPLRVQNDAEEPPRGESAVEKAAYDPLRSFLLRTVSVGIRTTLMVLLSLALYPLLPGNGIESLAIYLVILGTAALGVAAVWVLAWERALESRVGQWLMYLWSMVDIVLVTLGVAVTGSGRSELFLLYGLTTIFFAIAYPRRSQLFLFGFTIACYSLVLYVAGPDIAPAIVFLRLALLVSLACLGSFLSAELIRLLRIEHAIARQLRKADDTKNSFLTAVSHELRTPLTVVLGFAETLAREDLRISLGERQEFARKIAVNARKLTGLLDDLLDVDRLSYNVDEPKVHYTDIGDLVRATVDDSDLRSRHSVYIETKSVIVPVEEKKIARLVHNLISNVEKHTPEGTPVWIRVEGESDGALIVVEDEGPGIPDDLSGAMFDLFRQGPTVPTHSPGIGKGLFLVARFAALHRGRVWAEQRPGGGAAFKVFLPGRTPHPHAEAS